MRSSACSTTSAPCWKDARPPGAASSRLCASFPRNNTSMAYGANAAILYRPEAFTTSGTRLMGRQAAGEGFMRGFVRHANVDRLYCYAPLREQVDHFAKAATANGNQRPITWLTKAIRARPAKRHALSSRSQPLRPRLAAAALRSTCLFDRWRHPHHRLGRRHGLDRRPADLAGAGMGCADLYLPRRAPVAGVHGSGAGRVPGVAPRCHADPEAASAGHSARHRYRPVHARS